MMTVGIWKLTVLLACAGGLAACGGVEDAQAAARVEVQVDPSPPRMGPSSLNIRLTDESGQPVTGAVVRVEGNMNHAGMKPVFTDLTESEPGRYAGTLEFTMGGDWFLLINARLPDGTTISHKEDIHGVKAQ